jgi:HEAT repeat protein
MTLRRRSPLVLCVLSIALSAHAGQDSYFQSRPLSEWIADLGARAPGERAAAADAIAHLAILHGGSSVAAAVNPLERNLNDRMPSVRETAAGALEQIGQPAGGAVGSLLALLEADSDAAVRRRAALALARVDPAAAPVVAGASRALQDDADSGVRQAAAIVLVASQRAAAPAQRSLADAIADDDAGVRLYAAAALVRVEGPGRGVPVLLAALQHPEPAWRAEAAGMLGEIAQSETEVLPALAQALQDEDPAVRVAAADALGRVGRPARSYISALGARLRDPDEEVRERVAVALARIRD